MDSGDGASLSDTVPGPRPNTGTTKWGPVARCHPPNCSRVKTDVYDREKRAIVIRAFNVLLTLCVLVVSVFTNKNQSINQHKNIKRITKDNHFTIKGGEPENDLTVSVFEAEKGKKVIQNTII